MAAWKSKLICNEIDRCMKAEQHLKDAKTKHVHLLNHIRRTRNEQARKSVAYRDDAKVSDIKAKKSLAKAKLLATSNVQLVSKHFKELRDIEHKNTDLLSELEIMKREKENATSELQCSIDAAVQVAISNERLGASIEVKIRKDNTRKEIQNMESKHYRETRAIRKENVKLVGTIEEKVKLVGIIECNRKSEMARHLESNYDNDQLLASLRRKHKLHNESLREKSRDKYKLLHES